MDELCLKSTKRFICKSNYISTSENLQFAYSPHLCSSDAVVWGNDPPWEGSPGSLVV
jgi:hypothetical protein